jgi:hypothetical protein
LVVVEAESVNVKNASNVNDDIRCLQILFGARPDQREIWKKESKHGQCDHFVTVESSRVSGKNGIPVAGNRLSEFG